MQVPETILSRIKAVKALLDGATTEGEKAAAETKFLQLLEKYGLSESDLKNKRVYYFKYKSASDKRLLMQINGKVTNWKSGSQIEMFKVSGKKELGFELTELEYQDMSMLYTFYKKAWEKEIKEHLLAWIRAQDLAAPSTKTECELEEIDWAAILEMLTREKNIKKLNVYKQLTG